MKRNKQTFFIVLALFSLILAACDGAANNLPSGEVDIVIFRAQELVK